MSNSEAKLSVMIELLGSEEADISAPPVVTRKQVDPNAGTGCRLVLTLPQLLTAEQASVGTALLLDELEQLGKNAVVEGVKISHLRFTPEGVAGIKMLLTMHAPTLKDVALNHIMNNSSTREDEMAVTELIHAFQCASLESIDVSKNTLRPFMWKEWMTHSCLKKLALDYVNMEDGVVEELHSFFTFADSIEDLSVVLLKPLGPNGVEAGNSIIRKCKNLKHFRWVYKHGTKTAALPWFGLRSLVQEAVDEKRQSLFSLHMEGARLSERDLGDRGLCGVLEGLTDLKQLKLRNIGLIDNAVKRVTSALIKAKPPLIWLDMSYNSIQCAGVATLAELAKSSTIMHSLKRLSLDHNKIDSEGFSKLLEVFGPSGDPELEVRFEGNVFDTGRIAFSFAQSMRKAEAERDALSNERDQAVKELLKAQKHLREITAAQTTILTDFRVVSQDKKQLQEERDSLLKAFAIMGSAKHIEENRRLLDRLGQLEDTVFGSRRVLDKSDSAERLRRLAPPRSGSNHSVESLDLNTLVDEARAPPRGATRASSVEALPSYSSPIPPHTPPMPRNGRRSSLDNKPRSGISTLSSMDMHGSCSSLSFVPESCTLEESQGSAELWHASLPSLQISFSSSSRSSETSLMMRSPTSDRSDIDSPSSLPRMSLDKTPPLGRRTSAGGRGSSSRALEDVMEGVGE